MHDFAQTNVQETTTRKENEKVKYKKGTNSHLQRGTPREIATEPTDTRSKTPSHTGSPQNHVFFRQRRERRVARFVDRTRVRQLSETTRHRAAAADCREREGKTGGIEQEKHG
jgi:hypothetical protein